MLKHKIGSGAAKYKMGVVLPIAGNMSFLAVIKKVFSNHITMLKEDNKTKI